LSPDGDDLLLTIRGNGARVPNARLVQAVGRAFAWRRELLKSGDWVSTLCQRFGVTDSWIHQLLALTQLSPSILRGVLTGQLRPSIRLDDLLAAAQQLDWAAQRRILKLK
jgi:hypothetical protein